MTCLRCQGKMISEKYSAPFGEEIQLHCLCCGAIIDKQILENRKEHPKPNRPARSRRSRVVEWEVS